MLCRSLAAIRRGYVHIEQAGFGGWTASGVERRYSENTNASENGCRDDVSAPDGKSRLYDLFPVDPEFAFGDELRGKRTCFDDTCVPKPFIETLSFAGSSAVRHGLRLILCLARHSLFQFQKRGKRGVAAGSCIIRALAGRRCRFDYRLAAGFAALAVRPAAFIATIALAARLLGFTRIALP